MQTIAINNRNKVREMLEENSTMILFSGNLIKSSADQSYPFVVNKNFYHLTSINEPNLILVVTNNQDYLFIEKSDEMFEKWEGKKITKEQAFNLSQIENIDYVDNFDLAKFKNVNTYLDLEEDQFNGYDTLGIKFNKENKLNAKDAYSLVAKSRSTKNAAEVNKIKEALETTDKGLKNILSNLKVGVKESYFEACFDFVLKTTNTTHSFDTIAASGENATVLHYVTNDEIVNDNELILFDLGATSDVYCADISRTYPANGKFTERQKELYEMVLAANKLVIEAIKPGISMHDLNNLVIAHYEKELLRLNVIKDRSEVSKYYYHNVSHSLGLDTHDVGLDRGEKLVAGNLITVEPGIYIKEEKIGIRIEDNILVTEDGNINLSKDIIKEVADIESFISNEKA